MPHKSTANLLFEEHLLQQVHKKSGRQWKVQRPDLLQCLPIVIDPTRTIPTTKVFSYTYNSYLFVRCRTVGSMNGISGSRNNMMRMAIPNIEVTLAHHKLTSRFWINSSAHDLLLFLHNRRWEKSSTLSSSSKKRIIHLEESKIVKVIAGRPPKTESSIPPAD